METEFKLNLVPICKREEGEGFFLVVTYGYTTFLDPIKTIKSDQNTNNPSGPIFTLLKTPEKYNYRNLPFLSRI